MSSSQNTASVGEKTTLRLPKFNPDDLSKIIGPSFSACEKNTKLKKLPSLRNRVIGPSWSSYNLWKKQTNFEGEDPKTPLISLEVDEDGVYAEIVSSSSEMTKLVTHHLKKYEESFKAPQKKMLYTMFAELDHDSIPRVIGRGGSIIRNIRSEAVEQMDEFSDEDYEKCRNSWLKVDPFTPREHDDFVKMVEDSDRHDFLGWGVNEGAELCKITLSSFASEEAFQNFSECVNHLMTAKVNEIMDKNSEFQKKKQAEIDEVMGLMESE